MRVHTDTAINLQYARIVLSQANPVPTDVFLPHYCPYQRFFPVFMSTFPRQPTTFRGVEVSHPSLVATGERLAWSCVWAH